MQRLLAFIEHNIHIILFTLLQVICGFLLFNLNPYQQASFSHSAAFISDATNSLSSNITGFIDLKNQNQILQDQIATQFRNDSKSTLHYMSDTITIKDTSRRSLFEALPAEVVYNTVYKANNVFIINKGTEHGVNKNMGVISSQGIAGIVLHSNQNYSSVMSLLNTNMSVIPTINDMERYSSIIWDNTNPETMKIKGINKLEEIEVGDKVYTGKSSLLFPPGILIGAVSKLTTAPNSQYFITEIKTSTNFQKLDYVFVIQNKDIEEISNLLPSDD